MGQVGQAACGFEAFTDMQTVLSCGLQWCYEMQTFFITPY